MFLKKENGALRSRLAGLDSDLKLGRISRESYESQSIEILVLLDKLKEPLNPVEQELVRKVSWHEVHGRETNNFSLYSIRKTWMDMFLHLHRKLVSKYGCVSQKIDPVVRLADSNVIAQAAKEIQKSSS